MEINYFSAQSKLHENCVIKRIIILFQLRDSPMCVLFHLSKEEHTGDALVSTAILHAALLHEFQHQFLVVRYVRHYVSPLSGADTT